MPASSYSGRSSSHILGVTHTPSVKSTFLLSVFRFALSSLPAALGYTASLRSLKAWSLPFSFQDQAMNTSVMRPALITPLTMATHQLAENAPLLYRAWTWPPSRPGSAPGMMGQAHLNTERWRPKAPRKTEEAKVRVTGAADY